jgi:hypothetical protein
MASLIINLYLYTVLQAQSSFLFDWKLQICWLNANLIFVISTHCIAVMVVILDCSS